MSDLTTGIMADVTITEWYRLDSAYIELLRLAIIPTEEEERKMKDWYGPEWPARKEALESQARSAPKARD